MFNSRVYCWKWIFVKKWRDPRRRHAGQGSSDGMSGGPQSRVFKIWSSTSYMAGDNLFSIFSQDLSSFQGCRGSSSNVRWWKVWPSAKLLVEGVFTIDMYLNTKPKFVELGDEVFAEWCLAQFLASAGWEEGKGNERTQLRANPSNISHLSRGYPPPLTHPTPCPPHCPESFSCLRQL